VTTRQLLAGATCLTRVLTDPVTGDVRAVDGTSYRPPAALRRFLQTRDGTCRFPGCGRVVTGCDNDHVQDWARRGPTTAGNLLNLCRHHHRLKHLGGWSATLHPDGRATWHSPRARTYTTEPAWTPPPTPPPTPAGTTSSTRTAGSDFRDGETSADGSDALAPLPGRGLPSSLPGPDDPPPF
ncbi:HNH endonuclease signature motif containing protein, partial [Cellulomonas marina]